ncbi:MAG: hypothetical protein AAGI03_01540 [Pseudomonadota bacterium]
MKEKRVAFRSALARRWQWLSHEFAAMMTIISAYLRNPTSYSHHIRYGLVAICVLVIAGALYAGWVLTPVFLAWAPEHTERARSEVFRNYGLVLAGCIGIAIAVWRGYQTDKQIKQVQEQMDRETQRVERDRFIAAMEDVSSEAESRKAIGLARISGHARSWEDTPLRRDARTFISAHLHSQKFVDGTNYSNALVWDSGLVAPDLIKKVEGVHFQNFRLRFGSRNLPIIRCRLERGVIATRTSSDTTGLYSCFLGEVSFGDFDTIEFVDCVLTLNLLDLQHTRLVHFRNCRFLDEQIADPLDYNFEHCFRVVPKEGKAVVLNQALKVGRIEEREVAIDTVPDFGSDDDSVVLRRRRHSRQAADDRGPEEES